MSAEAAAGIVIVGAGQAAVRATLGSDVFEHLQFSLRRGAQFVLMILDIAMAGRTGTGTTTFGLHTFNAVTCGGLHQAPTIGNVDLDFVAGGFNKSYLGHISLLGNVHRPTPYGAGRFDFD